MRDAGPADSLSVHIGTPSFLSALFAHIHDAADAIPVDSAILQSLLLCLIAGDRHLILRTAEEDVALVVKLAALILSSVFGLPTHKLRIHARSEQSDTSPSAVTTTFLRSLFLPPTSSSSHISQDEQSITGHRKRNRRPMSRSSTRSTNFTAKSPASYANDATHSHLATPFSTSPSDPFNDSKATPSNPAANQDANISQSRIYSPTPLRPHGDATSFPLHDVTTVQLPNALVISGLEHASFSSQKALTQVLLERRVIIEDERVDDDNDDGNKGRAELTGCRDQQRMADSEKDLIVDDYGVWNLPEDFIAVYVCPFDSRERPPIHKTLLDRFAMSATVSLNSTVRSRAMSLFRPVSYRSASMAPSQTTPLSTPPLTARPLPHSQSHMRQLSSAPASSIVTSSLLQSLRDAYCRTTIAPLLSLYIADLFSAARHHPQLEGRLLSASSMKDAEDLARAARVLGSDSSGTELIEEASRPVDVQQADHVDVGTDTSHDDTQSDTGFFDIMDGIGSGNGTIDPGVANGDFQPDIDPSDEDEKSFTPAPPVLDVSETDIARIAPRVMSHRLRVRDGPQSEVLGSAVFGAAFRVSDRSRGEGYDGNGVDENEPWETRCTVKDILVRILSEV